MSMSGFEGHEVVAESGNFLLVAAPSHAISSWSAVFASVYTRQDSKSWVVEILSSSLSSLDPVELTYIARLAELVYILSPDQRYSIVNIKGLNEDE